jgi:thymidylate kinase
MRKNPILDETLDLSKVVQRYFVFEGILCCGKSTQLALAKDYLEKKNYKVACFEEASELIRPIFRQLKVRDDWIEGHLFCADTLYQNELIKRESLDTMILEERSFLSSFVYQRSDQLPEGILLNWHNLDVHMDDLLPKLASETFRMPDCVIILDVQVSTALERMQKSSHQVEKWDDEESLSIARKKYESVTRRGDLTFPIYLIKEDTIENTWKQVRDIIDEIIKNPLKRLRFFGSFGKRIY